METLRVDESLFDLPADLLGEPVGELQTEFPVFPPEMSLFAAVGDGDVLQVPALPDQGVDPDARNILPPEQTPPIFIAAKNNHADVRRMVSRDGTTANDGARQTKNIRRLVRLRLAPVRMRSRGEGRLEVDIRVEDHGPLVGSNEAVRSSSRGRLGVLICCEDASGHETRRLSDGDVLVVMSNDS